MEHLQRHVENPVQLIVIYNVKDNVSPFVKGVLKDGIQIKREEFHVQKLAWVAVLLNVQQAVLQVVQVGLNNKLERS
jgi:hypothetical protein